MVEWYKNVLRPRVVLRSVDPVPKITFVGNDVANHRGRFFSPPFLEDPDKWKRSDRAPGQYDDPAIQSLNLINKPHRRGGAEVPGFHGRWLAVLDVVQSSSGIGRLAVHQASPGLTPGVDS